MPWLRLAPFLSRPSKAPPVSGSHMTTPPSLSPRNQLAAAVIPSTHRRLAVDCVGTGTGVGEGRHLNGLLVETGTMVVGATAPDGGDGEMALSGLAVEQPLQEVQPVPNKAGRSSAEPAAIIASGSVALA